jgi:hypothetical protein
LEPETEAIVKEFCDFSFEVPILGEKLAVASSVRATLEGAQAGYFRQLLEAHFDTAHFDAVLKVGYRHAVLDVKPRWNVGNYVTYSRLVFPRLAQHLDCQPLMETILSFQKAFLLDATLAFEAYLAGLFDRMVDLNENLPPAAGGLSTSASQVDEASREIAQDVQQIATGATEQTQKLQDSNDRVTELAHSVENVSSDRSGEGMEAAHDGSRSVSETIAAMETITVR